MRGQMSEAEARLEIAAITGSLRAGSWARSLARAAVDHLPSDVGLTIWDGLGSVPGFNEDLESETAPSGVADMRQLIEECDALLIVTPEYNMSIPGVLKNALDWVSRPYGQSPLIGKPVAVVGTSPLPSGGASALSDVGKLVSLIGAHMVESDLAIGLVHTRFDEEGRISDPALAVRIGELLAKVADAADLGSGSLKAS
jgi:chromate reductase, NAD(P)H dehydrogenase (quinone)